jgi:hypothetical protein
MSLTKSFIHECQVKAQNEWSHILYCHHTEIVENTCYLLEKHNIKLLSNYNYNVSVPLIRAITLYVNQEALLMIYYAYFHSIIHYGIISWGNSSHAINIFRLQKSS